MLVKWDQKSHANFRGFCEAGLVSAPCVCFSNFWLYFFSDFQILEMSLGYGSLSGCENYFVCIQAKFLFWSFKAGKVSFFEPESIFSICVVSVFLNARALLPVAEKKRNHVNWSKMLFLSAGWIIKLSSLSSLVFVCLRCFVCWIATEWPCGTRA